MANTKKNAPRYNPKAQDRKRNLIVQLGLTSIVVVFAVALVLYIVMSKGSTAASHNGDIRAVRIASDSLITQDGTDEPKAVLSIYEDFQCPHCRVFEETFGPTIASLVDSGVVAADYYMVAILNTSANRNYSTRSANAAYCVADESEEAVMRFRAALFAQQPLEGSADAPDDASLIETARQAGVVGAVPGCVNEGTYDDMVQGLAAASQVRATPTIRLNGERINPATPQDLVDEVKAVVGDVPGLQIPTSPVAATTKS